jgi:DNA-binding NarL/FixJ family response regulator
VTINNAVEIIPLLQKNFELLILDWEMPQLNGKKILNYTKKIGIPYYKIVIVSTKDDEELHNHFKIGEVLSVINKTDVNQMNALYTIIENISCY